MFNRPIRFKNKDYYIYFSQMPRIFFIFQLCIFELLDFWIILFLDITISHFLHFWTFGVLNFWILFPSKFPSLRSKFIHINGTLLFSLVPSTPLQKLNGRPSSWSRRCSSGGSCRTSNLSKQICSLKQVSGLKVTNYTELHNYTITPIALTQNSEKNWHFS